MVSSKGLDREKESGKQRYSSRAEPPYTSSLERRHYQLPPPPPSSSRSSSSSSRSSTSSSSTSSLSASPPNSLNQSALAGGSKARKGSSTCGRALTVALLGPVTLPPESMADMNGAFEDNMSGQGQRKRIAVACSRCRKRKIRCSGESPGRGACTNCKNAGEHQCLFLRVSSNEMPISQGDSYGYNLDSGRAYATRGSMDHQYSHPVSHHHPSSIFDSSSLSAIAPYPPQYDLPGGGNGYVSSRLSYAASMAHGHYGPEARDDEFDYLDRPIISNDHIAGMPPPSPWQRTLYEPVPSPSYYSSVYPAQSRPSSSAAAPPAFSLQGVAAALPAMAQSTPDSRLLPLPRSGSNSRRGSTLSDMAAAATLAANLDAAYPPPRPRSGRFDGGGIFSEKEIQDGTKTMTPGVNSDGYGYASTTRYDYGSGHVYQSPAPHGEVPILASPGFAGMLGQAYAPPPIAGRQPMLRQRSHADVAAVEGRGRGN